jgi:hypothetical protein
VLGTIVAMVVLAPPASADWAAAQPSSACGQFQGKITWGQGGGFLGFLAGPFPYIDVTGTLRTTCPCETT